VVFFFNFFSNTTNLVFKNTCSASPCTHSHAGTELHISRILVLIKICFHLGTILEENFKKKQKNLHVLQNNVKLLKREFVISHHSIVQRVEELCFEGFVLRPEDDSV
jgi:hypothetical protein